ncbi:hypothetical protein [Microbacterium sp. TNHR37B]|uniref:hypothetical protein n=1 Tax=Microbacterium sp. TNHR37B TaxID=1775956 RepID=UPI0007B1CB1E|nr:hypothetical protein [Microbacterium sp. TNHR37B]KZE91177.1 hypothetical protein AVP41_00712 [Microbacterium sp. TNHR37B]
MSILITSNTGATATAATVMPVTIGYAGGARIHELIGRGDPDVTHSPTGSRSGDLELMVTGQEAVASILDLHRAATWLEIVVASEPLDLSMRYVVPRDRELTATQEPAATNVWRITVPFREVSS